MICDKILIPSTDQDHYNLIEFDEFIGDDPLRIASDFFTGESTVPQFLIICCDENCDKITEDEFCKMQWKTNNTAMHSSGYVIDKLSFMECLDVIKHHLRSVICDISVDQFHDDINTLTNCITDIIVKQITLLEMNFFSNALDRSKAESITCYFNNLANAGTNLDIRFLIYLPLSAFSMFENSEHNFFKQLVYVFKCRSGNQVRITENKYLNEKRELEKKNAELSAELQRAKGEIARINTESNKESLYAKDSFNMNSTSKGLLVVPHSSSYNDIGLDNACLDVTNSIIDKFFDNPGINKKHDLLLAADTEFFSQDTIHQRESNMKEGDLYG